MCVTYSAAAACSCRLRRYTSAFTFYPFSWVWALGGLKSNPHGIRCTGGPVFFESGHPAVADEKWGNLPSCSLAVCGRSARCSVASFVIFYRPLIRRVRLGRVGLEAWRGEWRTVATEMGVHFDIGDMLAP